MSKKMIKGIVPLMILVALSVVSSGNSVAAEKYPSRPVEMICGYPPGGAMDLTMRTWSKYLEKYLGVTIVPVNKPGAGAIVACTYVANAKPDGYTLGCVGDHLVQQILSGRSEYKYEDFHYICLVDAMANTMAVPFDSPWKTMQEFVDYAHKNPGTKCAHPGLGSAAHLRMENINQIANLKLTAVAMNGDAEVIPALLGKHVPIGVTGGAAGKAQANAGKLRILMSFDPPAEFGLDPNLPDLQAVFGKNTPDVPVRQYLVVPAKTPEDIALMLERAMEKVTKDPDFIKDMNKASMGVQFIAGPALMKANAEHNAKLEAIMKSLGLTKK